MTRAVAFTSLTGNALLLSSVLYAATPADWLGVTGIVVTALASMVLGYWELVRP